MTDKFNTIAAFLSETDWNAHFTLTFADVCRHFRADPGRMDNMMYATYGMSGDEIIEQYRTGAMDFPPSPLVFSPPLEKTGGIFPDEITPPSKTVVLCGVKSLLSGEIFTIK